MTPRELLADLTTHGVTLTRYGDRLRVKSPPGVVTADLYAAIRCYKLALLALLDPTMPVALDLTLDDLAAGELKRLGFEVVRFDPDLTGYPWNPAISVRPM